MHASPGAHRPELSLGEHLGVELPGQRVCAPAAQGHIAKLFFQVVVTAHTHQQQTTRFPKRPQAGPQYEHLYRAANKTAEHSLPWLTLAGPHDGRE